VTTFDVPTACIGLIPFALLAGAAVRIHLRQLREFAAHDAEIERKNAELHARIKGGCRQRIDRTEV
jgi:hypothetical protein